MSEREPTITLHELTDRRHARPALVMFLRELHESAFPPEELQYTSEFMLDHAGRNGYQLLLIDVDHEPIGYQFLRILPEQKVGYLWYMAIDEARRGAGYGGDAIRAMLTRVRSTAPGVRALFLESRRPDPDDADAKDAKMDERRTAFYQRLGAVRISGIDYGLPAADDPTRLIHYEILLFSLEDENDPAFLRDQIAQMMRQNFPQDDDRLEPMLASLAHLKIEPPARA